MPDIRGILQVAVVKMSDETLMEYFVTSGGEVFVRRADAHGETLQIRRVTLQQLDTEDRSANRA